MSYTAYLKYCIQLCRIVLICIVQYCVVLTGNALEYVAAYFNDVLGVGQLRCPEIMWETIRKKQAHTQLVRERSSTDVSAR